MSVIDHVEIAVKNAQVSLKFFEAALAPLGFSLIISVPPERTLSGGARYGLGPVRAGPGGISEALAS